MEPAGVPAAKFALDVPQFLSGIDATARKHGVDVSGALDMNPKVPPSGWNIVPDDTPAPICDEPLRSEEPTQKLVCDGGAP